MAELHQVLQFLHTTYQLECSVLIGHSRGANVVLEFAATYDGFVPKIVNLAGRYHMEGGFAKHPPELVSQCLSQPDQPFVWKTRCRTTNEIEIVIDRDHLLSFLQHQKRIDSLKTSSDVLTIHGAQDSVIPVQDAQAFQSRLLAGSGGGQYTLCIIPEADHQFRGCHTQVMQLIKSFVENSI